MVKGSKSGSRRAKKEEIVEDTLPQGVRWITHKGTKFIIMRPVLMPLYPKTTAYKTDVQRIVYCISNAVAKKKVLYLSNTGTSYKVETERYRPEFLIAIRRDVLVRRLATYLKDNVTALLSDFDEGAMYPGFTTKVDVSLDEDGIPVIPPIKYCQSQCGVTCETLMDLSARTVRNAPPLLGALRDRIHSEEIATQLRQQVSDLREEVANLRRDMKTQLNDLQEKNNDSEEEPKKSSKTGSKGRAEPESTSERIPTDTNLQIQAGIEMNKILVELSNVFNGLSGTRKK